MTAKWFRLVIQYIAHVTFLLDCFSNFMSNVSENIHFQDYIFTSWNPGFARASDITRREGAW
jgi:hypothetical protein